MRTLDRAVSRTGVLQIDSVNVLQRAHYMPLFARMGPYDTGLLHRAASRSPRRLVEYWAHQAAYMPIDLWPYMRHRMQRARVEAWGGPRSVRARKPQFVQRVLHDVEQHGPVTARTIDDDLPRRKDNWGWNWSEVKQALEFLFFAGQVTASGRNAQFERLYDIPERVLPAEVLHAPTPEPEDAHIELIRRAAISHGVATARCLNDYYRMRMSDTEAAIRALQEAGDLVPVHVEGWDRQAYLHRTARVPRKAEAAAVLSPFDPLVWERQRTEELFGFRYRIEIYVPKPQRVYGYYVLPFLLGQDLVARVDLKADRTAGVLQVLAAYAEPGAPQHTGEALFTHLQRLAHWLGLQDVRVHDRGDLARGLRDAAATAS